MVFVCSQVIEHRCVVDETQKVTAHCYSVEYSDEYGILWCPQRHGSDDSKQYHSDYRSKSESVNLVRALVNEFTQVRRDQDENTRSCYE